MMRLRTTGVYDRTRPRTKAKSTTQIANYHAPPKIKTTNHTEGASEWVRCKMMRLRTTGVYDRTRPRTKAKSTTQIANYHAPPKIKKPAR